MSANVKSSRIRTINRRSRLTDTFHVHICDHCGTLKNPHTIRKEQGMKFPVLWLASVSLSVWVGTEKKQGVRLARDLVSRSRITLHFGAKAVKTKTKKTKTCFFKTVSCAAEGVNQYCFIFMQLKKTSYLAR